MQYILNNLFLALLALVAESSAAYLLYDHGYEMHSKLLDEVAAVVGTLHLIVVLSIYYSGSGNFFDRSLLSRLSKWLVLSRF